MSLFGIKASKFIILKTIRFKILVSFIKIKFILDEYLSNRIMQGKKCLVVETDDDSIFIICM